MFKGERHGKWEILTGDVERSRGGDYGRGASRHCPLNRWESVEERLRSKWMTGEKQIVALGRERRISACLHVPTRCQ